MVDLRASLVADDYVDPAVYAAEVERAMRAEWLPVCRADQIPSAGDRFAITLCDRPVIALRTADGEIRVVANVCTHRASRLVDDGPGHDDTLVCPYHRWAYRLDGSLIGAPLAEGADLDGACLPLVRHIVWQGFVLVNLSGAAPEPFADLHGLDDEIAPWHWSELVTVASRSFPSTWNWKVMVENWVECYHHLGTHRDSVEPFLPARATEVTPNRGAPWVAMRVHGIEGAEGRREEWLPGLAAEVSRELSVWSLFPFLMGGSTSRHGFWLQLEPVDATHHVVTWHLLLHPDQVVQFTPEQIAAEMAMLEDVHREDMLACRRVQEGLASGFVTQPRLTALESPIADFQRWLRARLVP
jgi:phenylpropionate dioxygenase-like ring-hydroxylating dioxygenase large terminal subunit